MASASAGVQSEVNVNSSPTVPGQMTKPSTWSIVWFGVSALIIFGFHLRLFGHPVPPAAHFP